jgi:hypothetical protein
MTALYDTGIGFDTMGEYVTAHGICQAALVCFALCRVTTNWKPQHTNHSLNRVEVVFSGHDNLQ